eukprot:m.848628 g.848628  ORF g.848628 m.848628 type:complete len:534 (+) comp23489_c0_seq2:356-1957(+)
MSRSHRAGERLGSWDDGAADERVRGRTEDSRSSRFQNERTDDAHRARQPYAMQSSHESRDGSRDRRSAADPKRIDPVDCTARADRRRVASPDRYRSHDRRPGPAYEHRSTDSRRHHEPHSSRDRQRYNHPVDNDRRKSSPTGSGQHRSSSKERESHRTSFRLRTGTETCNASAEVRDRRGRVQDRTLTLRERHPKHKPGSVSRDTKQLMDPALDFCATTFDAAKALKQDLNDIVLPYPSVLPLDNLSACVRVMFTSKEEKLRRQAAKAAKIAKLQEQTKLKESHPYHPKRLEEAKNDNDASADATEGSAATASVTKHTKAARKSKRKNVVDRMHADRIQGPLGVLHRAFRNRVRVSVHVRGHKSIRGTLTGVVIAFDKHCNMVLGDVTEVYTTTDFVPHETHAASASARSFTSAEIADTPTEATSGHIPEHTPSAMHPDAQHEATATLASQPQPPAHLNQRQKARWRRKNGVGKFHSKTFPPGVPAPSHDRTSTAATPPSVRVLATVRRTRHFKQLFLRGDSVVTVSVPTRAQ